MIAALPMYDWPETEGMNDMLWARLSAEITASQINAPLKLTRGMSLQSLWLSPDLLLAQTCSYPLQTVLKNKVHYIATPSYSVEGCEKPGHYRSVILMRRQGNNLPAPSDGASAIPEWLNSTRLAFNGDNSMSGYHALKHDLKKQFRILPTHQIETGGHRASVIAVANNKADLCSIDCVSWAMAQAHEPAAQFLQVVGWTAQRPGLPLITALQTDSKTIEALTAAARAVLGAVVLETAAHLDS